MINVQLINISVYILLLHCTMINGLFWARDVEHHWESFYMLRCWLLRIVIVLWKWLPRMLVFWTFLLLKLQLQCVFFLFYLRVSASMCDKSGRHQLAHVTMIVNFSNLLWHNNFNKVSQPTNSRSPHHIQEYQYANLCKRWYRNFA